MSPRAAGQRRKHRHPCEISRPHEGQIFRSDLRSSACFSSPATIMRKTAVTTSITSERLPSKSIAVRIYRPCGWSNVRLGRSSSGNIVVRSWLARSTSPRSSSSPRRRAVPAGRRRRSSLPSCSGGATTGRSSCAASTSRNDPISPTGSVSRRRLRSSSSPSAGSPAGSSRPRVAPRSSASSHRGCADPMFRKRIVRRYR